MIAISVSSVKESLESLYSPEIQQRLQALRLWPACVQASILDLLTGIDSLRQDEASQKERQQILQEFKVERWGLTLDDLFIKYRAHLDQVLFSLIRVRDASLAQELYFRITEGEATFEEIAKQFSESPDHWTGGRSGPQPATQSNPQLARQLLLAPLGVVQRPFQIAQWYLILRVDERLQVSYHEELKERLLDMAFAEWVNEIQKEVLTTL